MRTNGFLIMTTVVTTIIVAAMVALASQQPQTPLVSRSGDTLALGTVSSRETDISTRLEPGNSYELDLVMEPFNEFVKPDRALTNQAESLKCPEDAEDLTVPELEVTICVPPGWQTEVIHAVQPETDGPVVALWYEPDLTRTEADNVSRLLMVALLLSPAQGLFISYPECPAPGFLNSEAGSFELCFLAPETYENEGIATVIRTILFRVASREAAPWGMLMATRLLGSEPPGMDDQAFRDAIAILANLRFD